MFQNLRGNGRIWIYVANRPLTQEEALIVRNRMNDFCSSWAAHGKQLMADFELAYNQIFILAADENIEAASGCSIDSATAIFKEIDAKYNLDLFNRLNLTFLSNDKIRVVHMEDINQAYLTGIIYDSITFLDNTVSRLDDFKSKWQVSFSKSWAFRKVKKSVQNA